MKKHKLEVWKEQLKNLVHTMKFSSLSENDKEFVENEMFYFNNSRIALIAWAVIAIEFINILHVALLSTAKLSTQNNQQYFTMYLLLLTSAIICLILRQKLRNKPEVLNQCYIIFSYFWMIWHALLSSMDLRRNPNIMVFITGIFGLSLLIRMKPMDILIIFFSSLFTLLIYGNLTMPLGIAINAIIITFVATIISCSRYFSTVEELGYRQKMIMQAKHRTQEKQTIELLNNQLKALLKHSEEILFLWDRETNTLHVKEAITLCSADVSAMLLWLNNSEECIGYINLNLDKKDTPSSYKIECTPQLDYDEKVIAVTGKICK